MDYEGSIYSPHTFPCFVLHLVLPLFLSFYFLCPLLNIYLLIIVVRQLELQVKSILESITHDENKKKELIRGLAVDKAEQLS